jgi:hypothetical protein
VIDDDSHGGNVLFPGREYNVPTVGINVSLAGNDKERGQNV